MFINEIKATLKLYMLELYRDTYFSVFSLSKYSIIFFLISLLKLWTISDLKNSGGTFLIISNINTGRNKKFNETKS